MRCDLCKRSARLSALDSLNVCTFCRDGWLRGYEAAMLDAKNGPYLLQTDPDVTPNEYAKAAAHLTLDRRAVDQCVRDHRKSSEGGRSREPTELPETEPEVG